MVLRLASDGASCPPEILVRAVHICYTKYVSALRRSIFQTLYGIDIITLLRGTQSAPVETLVYSRLMYGNNVVLPLFPDTRIRTIAT